MCWININVTRCCLAREILSGNHTLTLLPMRLGRNSVRLLSSFSAAGPSWRLKPLVAAAVLAGAVGGWSTWRFKAAGEEREFSLEEVAAKRSKEAGGIWVVHGGNVYDITEFVEQHPGGKAKIMLAAGGTVEPFWAIYKQHDQPAVRDILSRFKIGRLRKQDLEDAAKKVADVKDPFAGEPMRHPALVVRLAKPFNAETPVELIPDNYYTENQLFFVRNHLPVPQKVDEDEFKLEIVLDPRIADDPSMATVREMEFKVKDLKKFPKHSVTATIQCAGNRRSEMNTVKPVQGTAWATGAISTAKWTGARLCDVLSAAGACCKGDDCSKMKHVQFEGMDRDALSNLNYGASITALRACDELDEVILAYEMNDEPLPLDHGYPIRAIVPGVVGARSVKWLKRIVLSDRESESPWQQRDYKCFNSSTDLDSADYRKARAIQESPVQSAVCDPKSNSSIECEECEEITVKGYAFSGGGREIIRVDVSADGGKTWKEAELLPKPDPELIRKEKGEVRDYAWTLWKTNVPVTDAMKEKGEVELLCKAVDSSYNEQPSSFEHNWNFRGLLANAWHRVKIGVESNDHE